MQPYHDLDLTKFEDSDYLDDQENDKVEADLINWGGLLKKHLGPAKEGDQRLIEVEEVDRDITVTRNGGRGNRNRKNFKSYYNNSTRKY